MQIKFRKPDGKVLTTSLEHRFEFVIYEHTFSTGEYNLIAGFLCEFDRDEMLKLLENQPNKFIGSEFIPGELKVVK